MTEVSHAHSSLLAGISSPADLRKLDRQQLVQLSEELRAFIIESVARTGGHFSSNLGTVELTIALHYVFNTPYDRLVWDVGHQTYAHKILTGRKEGMATLRMYGGMSGFPRRSESQYDTFGVGHSSTSISAALGMAAACGSDPKTEEEERRRIVAVIGDGAMSAGMAFEALNNAGEGDVDLLVVLNDNKMSISPPVGGLNKYLARLLSGRTYNAVREAGNRMLGVSRSLREFARRAEEHVKGMITPGTLFEELGFNYIGPINGHDLESLIPTLQNLRNLKGPQFLHVMTRKGQGYDLAELDPVLYHGVSSFKSDVGVVSSTSTRPSFTQVFGDWLCDMAAADQRLVGITPAMCEGSGMVRFQKEFPERYFDVGIAEQHAVTFAAGLACEGLKPVVAIYSTFLQRAYDQLIHDVALQNLPVVFAVDRSGLVGADGPTHHGAFDISYLLCIPDLTIMVPSDEAECRQMLTAAFGHSGPAVVRYPRGSSSLPFRPVGTDLHPLPIGKGAMCRTGKRIAFIVFGPLLAEALKVGEKLDASVANMRFAKPLDTELIERLADEHDFLVTIEENAVMGGVGAEVSRALESIAPGKPVLRLGLPDRFVDHGDQKRLLQEVGLDAEGIEASLHVWIERIEKKMA